MYGHMIRSDLAWLHEMHSGKLIASFLYDASLLREAVTKALTGIVKDSLSLLFLTGVMFAMNWQFALIVCVIFPFVGLRSEEHTYELQSLMGNSYAVFCF